MSEGEVVERTPRPRTRSSIAGDLETLGLGAGDVVIVHASLSSLGWVCGGPVAVIQAFMDVLGPTGTLVMPAHSGDYSDPAEWKHPPVPEEWKDIIRENMPAFDPAIAPTRGLGIIAETFRKWPGVLRSSHPNASFAAWGPHAGEIIEGHLLDSTLGEDSPLARVYDLDGRVMLLGVGFGVNTSFHLAEYRVPEPGPWRGGAPILVNGQRVWKQYTDVDFHDEVFGELGSDFESTGAVRTGYVGSAATRFFHQREAVDFAVQWMVDHQERSD